MGEEFDILDEHGHPTGQVKARELVHRDGAFTKPAICLVRCSCFLKLGRREAARVAPASAPFRCCLDDSRWGQHMTGTVSDSK